MVVGTGFTDRLLSEPEVRSLFEQGLAQAGLAGKRVLAILPDSTRSGPIPLCFRLLTELLAGEVSQLDFMIALGTHQPMEEERLCRHLGITPQERAGRYGRVGIFNHDWQGELKHLGTIPAAELLEITGGLMGQDVPVRVNPRLFDYDHLLICGPVFPHEAVGFSGGNKYFFPGVAGPEVISFFHWLSAVITTTRVIGIEDTPVRRVVDRAAGMIDVPRSCFSMVVKGHDGLAGLYYGSPEESQRAAAALSARVHVTYVEKPFHTIISLMPEMYDDIWTAGKGMYKLEPVAADGGTVTIYSPGISEISYTHGKVLDRIGYHVRDYFLAQGERFHDVPGVVMAHSTHVKGAGTYEHGVERPRVEVVLATGVPRERCERVNLGYRDPATIHPEELMGREDEGILVVPRAGEMLYRLKGAEERQVR